MKRTTTTYIIQAANGNYYDGDGWTSVRDNATTYDADDLPGLIDYQGMTLELCDDGLSYCDADDLDDMTTYAAAETV